MNILFIHSHKFRKINSKIYSLGGLSENVLKRYIDQNDRITVIARIINEVKSKSNYSEITDSRIKILDINNIKKEGLKYNIKNADLIIVRLPCIIGNISLHIAKKYNKKCIVEVVGCAWDSYWNHGILGKLLAPIIYYIMKKQIKEAENVLYVSEKFLQSRYPTDGNQIACSDVCLKEVNDNVINSRITSKKQKDKIKITTIGAANVRYKGQQYVIKAISKLKKEGYKLEYQIIGSGDSSYLKQVAIKNNVEKEVKFIGSVPHDEIFEYLDDTDIYIQPSNLEGLCRALIEAMSRGCPCIASNVGGNPELINSKYIFKKKNVKDLIEKIKLILENDENIKESKYNFENARKYSDNKLNIIRNDFYKKIISSLR